MRREEWNEGLSEISAELVEEYIEKKDVLNKKKKAKIAWIRIGSLAACLALIVSAALPYILRAAKPDVSIPSPDTVPDTLPTWDNAKYSAEQISELFGATDSIETNAYTKVYVPKSEYLGVLEIPEKDTLDVYRYVGNKGSFDRAEFKAEADALLAKMSDALDVDIPEYTIKFRSNVFGRNFFDSYVETENLEIRLEQRLNEYRFSFSMPYKNEDKPIVLNGSVIQIDQRQSDEMIIKSLENVKKELFDIFGATFTDVKVVRKYFLASPYGAYRVIVYFYNEDAHPLNSMSETPVTDYIELNFDNHPTNEEDIVSDSILRECAVDYIKKRVSADELYECVSNERIISLEEAESLLYKGYVFGGHVCDLCMAAQDKVSFEGYDFVGMEYQFDSGYGALYGKALGVPFYTFYKKIGTVDNVNDIYAKTYVAAIELSGYKEYFESQKKNHPYAVFDIAEENLN